MDLIVKSIINEVEKLTINEIDELIKQYETYEVAGSLPDNKLREFVEDVIEGNIQQQYTDEDVEVVETSNAHE